MNCPKCDSLNCEMKNEDIGRYRDKTSGKVFTDIARFYVCYDCDHWWTVEPKNAVRLRPDEYTD